MIELNYMTTKTAAERWGISRRRVLTLCAGDRIEGLARVENIWLIPKDAVKPPDGRAARKSEPAARPFVKWAGGKGQLLPQLRQRYPKGLGKTVTKYCEPFVGGGAVLFDVLSRFRLDAVYISDVNQELIGAFRAVQSQAEELLELLEGMQREYLLLEGEARKACYLNKRRRFNELKAAGAGTLEMSALFLFLNRTCFNGLYRVNRRGQFNVPMGDYKAPQICDRENLLRISKALERVTIVCGDYRQAGGFIDERTFVYIDPPYRPLNATSAFTAYTENGFDDRAQVALAEFAKAMDRRGARIVLSNSDPKNADSEDTFFDDLYSGFQITRIPAARAINSKGDQRGKISELLITNY